MKTICGIILWAAMILPSAYAEIVTSFVPAIHQTEPKSVEISAYDSCIKVKNAPVGSVLEIYSVVGIKVKEIKLTSSDGEYPVNIPKGYYIIRIGETVRKVVIR